jgi:hypothetical protein
MVLIGVILAFVFILAVLRWWSEGIFEASDAAILIVVFGGLIIGLFGAQTFWQFLLAFIPLAAGGGFIIYSYYDGGMRAYQKRRCEEFVQAIQSDPRNLGAREHLAETLYNLGQLDRAIEEMQVAVNMGAGMECRYKLDRWDKERRLRDTTNPVCKWCMAENRPGSRTCSRCGSALPCQNALTRWLTGNGRSRARVYLIGIAGAALVAVSIALLPLKYAFIPLGLCVAALVGWALIWSDPV